MLNGKALLDKAAETCGGSRYALAKRLGVSQGQLADIAADREKIAPGLAVRLAELAGQDPVETLKVAVVEREKNAAAKADLARLLRVPAAFAGATLVVLSLSAPAPVQAADAPRSLCIMSTRRWLIWRLFSLLLPRPRRPYAA